MVQLHLAVRLKATKRLQPRPATAGLTTRSINVSAGLARAHTTYKRVKALSSLDKSVSNRQPCESNTFIVWLTEIKSTLVEVFKEDDVLY